MKNNIWSMLYLFGQIGFIIAIPAVIFAYLGRILDIRFNISPLFVLSGIGIALFISSLAIYKMIKKIEEK